MNEIIKKIFEFIKSNWTWLIGIVIILFILIRTKVRKFFWKVRKTGEKLKFKEFIKRWKKGVEGITNLQICKGQVSGTWITIIGITAGIFTTAIMKPKDMWWWVLIILIGSLLLTLLNQIGNLQKYWRVKKTDEQMKIIGEEMFLREYYNTCSICGKKEEMKDSICKKCREDIENIISDEKELKGGD